MNIEANTPSAPPAPAQTAGTGSTRSRTAGDGPGAASFMSMLGALTNPADEAALPEVDPGMPSGDSHDVGADEADADDAALQLAAAELEDGVSVIHPGPAVAAPVRPDAAVARATGTHVDPENGVAVEGGAATASVADLQDQQALRTAMEEAARAGTRRPGVAAANGGALARQWTGEAVMDAVALAGDAHVKASAEHAPEGLAWRPLVAPQACAGAASVVSMFEAGLAGLRAGSGGRGAHERAAARVDNLPDPANGGGFAPWTDGGLGSSAPQVASPVYAPMATTPVPSAALAQKLHFWVAGGVQSAALQLDAFGGGSVEVHIAVKGGEAYVEFRSDQPQARRMLLDTMPQLEHLLAGEGLMLSGGFVGGSAHYQSDGGSARRDRFAGGKPALDRIVEAPVGAAATPMRAAVGSAVDLFV